MPLILTSLFTFLGSIVGKFLTDGLLRFIAYKALAATLVITILPIILKNSIVWIVTELNVVITSVMQGSSMQPTVINFIGLAAWLSDCFMLADCLSVLLSALALRFILNLIPFVG